MSDNSPKRDKSHSSKLTLWLIVVLLLVLFIVGAATALLSAPEPQIMAPGPNYSNQEPRENI
jgi:flagellar basal body-associated protein FliL